MCSFNTFMISAFHVYFHADIALSKTSFHLVLTTHGSAHLLHWLELWVFKYWPPGLIRSRCNLLGEREVWKQLFIGCYKADISYRAYPLMVHPGPKAEWLMDDLLCLTYNSEWPIVMCCSRMNVLKVKYDLWNFSFR